MDILYAAVYNWKCLLSFINKMIFGRVYLQNGLAYILHLFIVPILKPRTCIPGGYLPEGAFTKFLNITSGGRWKAESSFSVCFTRTVKVTVEWRRSTPDFERLYSFLVISWGTRIIKVTQGLIYVCYVCKFTNVFHFVEEFLGNFYSILWNFLTNARDSAMN